MIYIVDTSLKCNFENRPEGPCTYCYNTEARRRVREQEIVDFEAIEETLREKYSVSPGVIILHGGEPLFMEEKILEKLLKMSLELSGRSSFQTNGSLISDKKIELLRQYKTRVGVSIDGYWPANRWRGKTKKNT
ncbi:MAG: radical SAM protein, partial [Candidatus Wildermuthbacteria bacterium]|nr:radical SAM protein [Candidatus Wildermuthbacteria bacterium]